MMDSDILEELKKERETWNERITELDGCLTEAKRKVSRLNRLITLLEENGKIW